MGIIFSKLKWIIDTCEQPECKKKQTAFFGQSVSIFIISLLLELLFYLESSQDIIEEFYYSLFPIFFLVLSRSQMLSVRNFIYFI